MVIKVRAYDLVVSANIGGNTVEYKVGEVEQEMDLDLNEIFQMFQSLSEDPSEVPDFGGPETIYEWRG